MTADVITLPGDTRTAIRAYVEEHQGATPKQISDATGLSHELVKKTCARMVEAGQLAAGGAGRYTAPVRAVEESVPSTMEVPPAVAALPRYEQHLAALLARRAELVATLADAQTARQIALIDEQDTTELARRCRQLREDLAAIDEDHATVDAWAAPLRAELATYKLTAQLGEMKAELARRNGLLSAWVVPTLMAFKASVPELLANVDQLLIAAARGTELATARDQVRLRMGPVCGALGIAPPPDPGIEGNADEMVARQLQEASRRRLFLAASRGDRASVMAVLAQLVQSA